MVSALGFAGQEIRRERWVYRSGQKKREIRTSASAINKESTQQYVTVHVGQTPATGGYIGRYL